MDRVLTKTILVVVLAVACGAGCGGNTDFMAPARLGHGLVFCLDGVGGYNWGPRWLREGLSEGDVPCAIYIFDWGHGPAGMFLADLLDEAGNRRRAAELARLVENYQKYYPGRPVYLIGHSGGAGIVVFALEEMRPETQVDGVFLLAPAVAPDRNLAPALRHVKRHCFATCSAADFALMGMGTGTFGTMDRKHTAAAGLVGFRAPEGLSDEDRRQYRKLRQAHWEAGLVAKGHLGGHMGWSSTPFSREFIAPILRGEEPADIFKPVLEDAGTLRERLESSAPVSSEGT